MAEAGDSVTAVCPAGLYGIDAARLARVQQLPHAVTLSGAAIPDRAAFFAALAASLHFPAYFGRNWDAVYDLLTDPGWFPQEGMVLILDSFQGFANAHPEQWQIGLRVFQDACDFWQPLGRPLHILLSGLSDLPPGVPPLPPACFADSDGD